MSYRHTLKYILSGLAIIVLYLFANTATAQANGVRAYQHCNFGGYSSHLPPGRYTLRQLQARGIRNDDLSAIQIPNGFIVKLYQHDNFTGRSWRFNRNVSCFVASGLNDVVSSIEVIKKPNNRAGITVFQHCNFGGYHKKLSVGRYDLHQLRAMGIRNDDLSAVKVPRGYQVTFFKHSGFQGQRWVFYGNDACFVDNGLNDQASSIIVNRINRPAPIPRSAKIKVFQHCNFGGYKVALAPGQYNLSRLKAMGIRNDDLSAIKVPNGRRVHLYEHDHFRGRRLTLTSHNSCLVNNHFNDVVSSIVVQ